MTIKKKIFISFASQERALAVCLREILNTYEQKFDVFVSDTSITAGEQWSEEIQENIRMADLMLVLCSLASIKRQWVNFECGAIAQRGEEVTTIPVCHSGLIKEDLPDFLPKNNALDLHDKDFLKSLFEKTGHTVTLPADQKKKLDSALKAWFIKNPGEGKSKQLQMVSLSCNDGILQIAPGRVIEERADDLPEDVWQAQIARMHAFLANPDEHPLTSIGVAIGIQNCLFDGHGLSVGVRIKSMTDSYSSGVGIGLGMFNTGYALLRPDNIQSVMSSDTLQDLFVPRPKYLKHFVTQGDEIHRLMNRMVVSKGLRLWPLRLADGREVIATLFINNSRRYPRFEIGVWKYIDLSLVNKPIVPGFGEDLFSDYRDQDDAKMTPWIWSRNGIIRYWSYPEERLIPRNKPVSYPGPQHSVLLTADCMNDTYGNPVCYTPFASDERLREDRKRLIPELFSAPARALLSCF